MDEPEYTQRWRLGLAGVRPIQILQIVDLKDIASMAFFDLAVIVFVFAMVVFDYSAVE
jgi:hypothetical protein